MQPSALVACLSKATEPLMMSDIQEGKPLLKKPSCGSKLFLVQRENETDL
jgi:hypothetical protein